jgi:hypothetical protein
METMDLSRAEWRTSSYSSSNGACVEVAADSATWVLVRDTNDREGPVLKLGPDAWRRFAGQVKVRQLPN